MTGTARRFFSAALLSALITVLVSSPAAAHRGHGAGRKAMGTIASYDGTTLMVTMTSGETATATTSDDTQVKVEHRGHRVHGKGHGHASDGTLESLTAGTFVLWMKTDEAGALEKIRVRPAVHDLEAETCTTEEDDATPDDGGDETTTPEAGDETTPPDDGGDGARLATETGDGTSEDATETDSDESTETEADGTDDAEEATEDTDEPAEAPSTCPDDDQGEVPTA